MEDRLRSMMKIYQLKMEKETKGSLLWQEAFKEYHYCRGRYEQLAIYGGAR